MNYYLRYFDYETLAHSVDEALDFLRSIREIEVTPDMERDLREFALSGVRFPKRYKVRPRVYFIVIKTTAATMQDFKEKKAAGGGGMSAVSGPRPQAVDMQPSGFAPSRKQLAIERLNGNRHGWYEGRLSFRRVVANALGKCEYRDTEFAARCIADSGQDCYNRIVAHLMRRVDRRSQFLSPLRDDTFSFSFLGNARESTE